MLIWTCNIAMVVAILMLMLFAFQLINNDLNQKYAMGKIIEMREYDGEGDGRKNVNYIAQYTNPENQQTYEKTWNAIQVFGNKVGDDIEVSYRKDSPENFSRGYRASTVLNVRNGMVVFIGMLLVALAVRLFLVGKLFSL